VIQAVKDKVRLFSEVPAALDFLLKEDFSYEDEAIEKVRTNATATALFGALADAFKDIPEWSADAAKAALTTTAQAAGAKPGQLMFPLRVALSGRGHGPDLSDMLNLLGQDRCVTRIRQIISMI
jgi:glutamyl-tRNA synthetase